ncbi:ABC transporter permease [Acidipropionibacterium virtanenii]|uniref:Transport permease protein n=1 Tax=Acidipropionibacterium virtanenii TaxID=2057246 RepID=A0A344UV35_9ACTN|nr:ABC transporter permease [Acidipropionibacterium virtanenii]AXE39133.1 hypothetical protein JS278_01977 [Acidipropionibacterium virtanenii]
MRALRALVKAEWLQLIRNPTALFMALILPSGLLLMQAYLIPGTRQPIALTGMTAMDYFVVVALVVATTSVTITNYPASVAGHRELGVLRRLDATPAGAVRLLLAQWLITLASLLGATLITLIVAALTFGMAPPSDVLMVALVLVLGAIAMTAIGSVIAATAATSQIAYGSGVLVFMLCLFLAGIWTPGPLMSESLRTIAAFTPPGAMAQSLQAAWYGGHASITPLLILMVWTVLSGGLSARIFRWR